MRKTEMPEDRSSVFLSGGVLGASRLPPRVRSIAASSKGSGPKHPCPTYVSEWHVGRVGGQGGES